MGAEAIAAALKLGGSILIHIFKAFQDLDPAKLSKVTDILDNDDPMKLEAGLALGREKMRRDLEEQKSEREG